jgi:hypothetical protein
VNNELEMIWKEAALALSLYYSGIFLERLRKTIKTLVRIADVPVEIQTKHSL